MKPVHLEGMGVLGSLIACVLASRKVEFTWSDNESDFTAWPACTGAIYPAGRPGDDDYDGYDGWNDLLTDEKLPIVRSHTEDATYVFNHRKPPHNGKYAMRELNEKLNVGASMTMHLNAQTLVPAVRKKFAGYQTAAQPKGTELVIAHGNPERYYWGWTRLVKLKYKPHPLFLTMTGERQRPAIYMRLGKFVMCYAYPVPGTEWWYAGSSLIRQTQPKSLEMEQKYQRWEMHLNDLSGNTIKVSERGEFIEGWRPATADGSQAPRVLVKTPRGIQVPTLWNSGVRHAPLVVNAVLKHLKLEELGHGK